MPENGEIKAIQKKRPSDSVGAQQSDIDKILHQQLIQKMKAVVYVFIAVYTGAFGATIASNLVQGIPQMMVITAASLILIVALFGILHLIKHDKLQTAANLLLIIAVTHLFAVQIALSGLLTIVILTGVALVFILGILVLRGRWWFMLAITAIFVFLCFAVELFSPFSRFDITLTPLADPAMTGVTISLLVVLIALSIRFAQFATIRTRLLVSFTVVAIIPGVLTVGVIMLDLSLGGELIRTAMAAAWLSMVTTTITIVLALAGALFFSRGISRPLNEMVAMAADVSAGELSREVIINRVDEIGKTAIAFNGMTNQLRSVIGELENRVSARTADLEQRTVQLETASRISRQIAAVREVDALVDAAVGQIHKQLGFDVVALFRLDDQRRILRLRGYAPDNGDLPLHRGYTLDTDGDFVFVSAVEQDRSVIVYDYDTEEQYVKLPEFPHIYSELALPLRIRDEVIGVLDLASTQPDSFTPQDATYLQIMADQITLALDNAILLASAEERLQEIERLITSQSIEGWQNLAAQRKNWNFTYDGSSVLRTPDQTVSPDDVDLVIPLTSDRSEMGNIRFKLPENQTLNENDVELARAIAREAGQAMESARLYTETQDALQEVGLLYRAIQAVVSAETPEEVLNGFVNNLVAPGIDQCMLLIKMDTATAGEGEFARVEAAWDASLASSTLIGEVWDMEQIAAITSEVLVINDIQSSTELDALSASILLGKGLHALMVIPLGTTGEIFGWLIISTLHSRYVFTEQQIRLYSNFADQLTQALVNIRLVQAARNRAQEAQFVREATERMRVPVEMQDVLEVAANEMRRILDLDDVVIQLTLPESDSSEMEEE